MPGTRFSVKLDLVAMLFLMFDVGTVFVCPWVVLLREFGWAVLWQMVVFLRILGGGVFCELVRLLRGDFRLRALQMAALEVFSAEQREAPVRALCAAQVPD